MKINFGVHLGFAVNRYPEPQEWARLLAEELNVHHAQFCSDLLQPHFPDEIISEQISRIKQACKEYDIKLLHTFTSQRWMYMGHPDEQIRKHWLWWLQRFSDISARIGAISAGSRLGIYSVNDFAQRRDFIFSQILDGWHEWAEHSKKSGLRMLTFETMSIPRELAETIGEAKRILKALNNGSEALPILPCLDTDQGNAFSGNPDDGDPYAWLAAFGNVAPVIHLKQRITGNVATGKPFTPEFNRNGVIFPEKVITALEESGAREISLYLEPSFRERLPYDDKVISDLKQSVEFWRPFVE